MNTYLHECLLEDKQEHKVRFHKLFTNTAQATAKSIYNSYKTLTLH